MTANQTKIRFWLTLLILLSLIVTTLFFSLNTGLIKLSPKDIGSVFTGHGTAQQRLILLDFRLPRIIISLCVGFALACAGAILQTTTQNPMADTGLLGINSGAGLVVMLYVAFFQTAASNQLFILPLLALTGACLSALIVYLLAYKKGQGVTPTRLLLTGVAISSCISALMLLLTLKLAPENYQFVMTWLAGSIWGTSWTFVWSLLPWLFILLPYLFFKASTLDNFVLGDEVAVGLGLNLQRERFKLIAAAVILAGVSVSVSGGIGFIGLIAPHMARRLVGFRHRNLLWITGLLGSCLLLIADTLGKALLQTTEIPAGVLVAVIGAPYFLYLLITTEN